MRVESVLMLNTSDWFIFFFPPSISKSCSGCLQCLWRPVRGNGGFLMFAQALMIHRVNFDEKDWVQTEHVNKNSAGYPKQSTSVPSSSDSAAHWGTSKIRGCAGSQLSTIYNEKKKKHSRSAKHSLKEQKKREFLFSWMTARWNVTMFY